MKQYVIGSRRVPVWCSDTLTPYRKMDGTTGFEFRGTERDYELKKGDRLVLHKGRIYVKRKVVQ